MGLLDLSSASTSRSRSASSVEGLVGFEVISKRDLEKCSER